MPIKLPPGEPCVFCEVVDGRITKGIVEETAHTLTMVNGRQFEKGQLLVVPRRHAPTLLELNSSELEGVMRAVQRAGLALVRAFDPDGITVYQNNGVVSGQEVPHFHMHVVPRRQSGSQWGGGPPHIAVLERPERRPQVEISLSEEVQLAESIRAHFHWQANGASLP